MKNLLLISFLLSFIVIQINGQRWIKIENSAYRSIDNQKPGIPDVYDSYELNFESFITKIDNAPGRFESKEEGILIDWPMPGKKMQKFRLKRSDVFHPDLAAKYPKIKAYTGYSLEDPTAILKISVSHKGIEGMLLSNQHETIYLDRFSAKSKNQYILYKRSDYQRELLPGEGQCSVEIPDDGYVEENTGAKFGDCQLRKFRLALACTGEYATFHGGNIPDVLAEYNASMVRVNGIYEKEASITMELIPETDQLIFLNSATDPYSNNDGGAMLGQNQSTIDQIIGFNNYDIGHVYSTGGGGIASLRSPCTGNKARGVTGLSNPTGDFFWVDYVAHEMGHQYGGNHTFNNSCNNNRSNNTAVEPGSGSTIMAYAGICNPNVQNNSDDYFHSVSLGEFANFVVAGNGSCAEIIPLDNNAPEIESITPSGLILPSLTPFMLTAEASDADDDMLTYCWEQIDNEIAEMPPNPESNDGPAFRSDDPTVSPTRIFPPLLPVLFGLTKTTWDVLPNADREMNFNLTVRDNNPLGGCTADEEVTINFTTSAGPFEITTQNTNETWNAGENQTILWDVANTDMAPVSCSNVDILFSRDRGETFDIILAENIPNNGEYEIIVPFELTPQGRIMIKCSSSIFFDINNRDIRVIAPFSTEISPSEISVCPGQTATYMIDYTVFDDDPVPATFSVNGLPSGATFTFTPEMADSDTTVNLTIGNLSNDMAGTYSLEILATGDVVTQTQIVSMIVSPDENSPVTIISPPDMQTGVSNAATFSWEILDGVLCYELEVSKNPGFGSLTFSGIITAASTSIAGLEDQTVYYWRVRGMTPCVPNEWFGTQSFQTSGLDCTMNMSTESVELPVGNTGTIESEIIVSEPGILGDVMVNLNIAHSYVGDLSGKLRGPNGIEVELFDQPGVPGSAFGCDGSNIVVSFSSNALMTADDFENTCNTTGNAIEGDFQPIQPFTALTPSSTDGIWTLLITDSFDDDGGEITDWSVTTCATSPLDEGVILKNNILQLNTTVEEFITPALLEIETLDAINTKFTLRSTPASGLVQKWNEMTSTFEPLGIGGIFSQDDINMNRVRYVLNDIDAIEDSFLFDSEDEQLRYSANNTFLIASSIELLSITAEVTDQISCFGETDGRIEVMGSGGIPNYTYSINDGPFESVNIFENLAEGEYTIVVKDDFGSEVSSTELSIIEPAQITFVHFPGINEITIGAEGGTGSYLYSLDGINYSEENTLPISDGETYKIYVQDENGCITESSTELTYYQIQSAAISTTDVLCKGETTGSITVNSVSGDLAPYTYQLNDEAPTDQNVFTGLAAGAYDIKITGSAGSSFTQMDIVIVEPEEALSLSSFVDGNTIILTGSGGGSMSYQYYLNGGMPTSNNSFADLPDGEYVGCVVDGFACEVCEMNIIVNTSTADPNLDQMNLYPNPTHDNFILSSESNIQFTIEVIDVTGKLVLKKMVSSNTPVNVEYLTPGLFLVKVNYKDSFRVFKLSKI